MDSILLNTIAPYAGTLVGSGVIGLAAGYFLKKVIKVILLIAGAIATVLILMAYKNMLIVNWAAIQHQSNDIAQQGLHTMTNALTSASHDMTAAGLDHADIAFPIVGATGFLPCLIIGFMKG